MVTGGQYVRFIAGRRFHNGRGVRINPRTVYYPGVFTGLLGDDDTILSLVPTIIHLSRFLHMNGIPDGGLYVSAGVVEYFIYWNQFLLFFYSITLKAMLANTLR
ncbi:hypothetical protein KCP75_22920 [Salmonella enterica subsp. enterica]|nr:hypothetical protein KCP75_22920 [Salmonella enterica subsp. enterica]